MAGQRARDQLELRMPRLPRIKKKSTFGDRIGKTGERRAHQRVVGKELVQSRNDADRRARRDAGKTRAIECVAANKLGDPPETLGPNQRTALVDVELAVVAQQNGIGRRRRAIERFQYVTAVSRGDVDDVHEHVGRARERNRLAEQLFEMQFALANAAPADRFQIVAIDELAEQSGPTHAIAIHVVERAAGIEAGFAAERDPF